MDDLRQAAEIALKYFEDAHGLEDTEVAIKEALRQALAHPDLAKVGEVGVWGHKREWIELTKEEVDSWELPDCPTVFEFAQFIEAKLREKNNV